MVKSKVLITTIFISGTVFAQNSSLPGAPGPAPGQVDISVKQQPTMTPAEMVGQSQAYFASMGEAVKRIQTLQDQAKREKDIIRLNCVTDKLVQAKVNINIAEQAMTTLQESIARTHEFTRLTIVNQKVLVLGTEAENCIGEDLSFVGATRVDVEVDPGIPTTDPTLPPTPGIDISRTPPASNYL